MPAPSLPGPAERYVVTINEAVYTGANVQDAKVTTRLNQLSFATVTLNLTSSSIVEDSGAAITLDRCNNLPLTGKVRVEDEVLSYTSRTGIDLLANLDAEIAAWLEDPDGYTPPPGTLFQLTGLTRGLEETPYYLHAPGRQVYIYPEPAEGDDITIVLGTRELLTGVVSHVERDESSNAIRIECIEIGTRVRDLQVTTKTLYQEKTTGEILLALIPPNNPPDHYWDTDFEVGVKMNYRLELGNYLMHIANLCLLANLDWWITTDATLHTIHCRTHRGSLTPGAIWTARLTALNLKRSTSKEDIFNSITAIGSSQEMKGSATTLNANTERITELTGTETNLSANCTAAATKIYGVNITDYVVGDTIQVGTEKMTITAKGALGELTVTRAVSGTTAAAHYVGDAVLMITSLAIESVNDLDNDLGIPAKVWIGSEKIQITGAYGGKILTLTRGVDGTTPYAHRAGTLVMSADDTNELPEDGSSIKNYGVRGMRQSVIGIADLDGLDKYAGAVMMALKDLLPGGNFQVPLSSFPVAMGLGDTFSLVEYGVSGSTNYRISGLVWDTSGLVTVEYGHPEEWILANFQDAAKAMQLATQATAPAAQAPIIQSSDDGKMVQVQSPDGLIWIRVQP